MNKLFLLAATAIAIHVAPVEAMERPVMKQSPMVLVELQANMKADLILAERKIGWEIKDELETQYQVVIQERLMSAGIAKLTTESLTEWAVKSDD